jgi:hypothetical protein
VRSWWVDAAGPVQDQPIADAEPTPRRFVLPGLADAHALAVGLRRAAPGAARRSLIIRP